MRTWVHISQTVFFSIIILPFYLFVKIINISSFICNFLKSYGYLLIITIKRINSFFSTRVFRQWGCKYTFCKRYIFVTIFLFTSSWFLELLLLDVLSLSTSKVVLLLFVAFWLIVVFWFPSSNSFKNKFSLFDFS